MGPILGLLSFPSRVFLSQILLDMLQGTGKQPTQLRASPRVCASYLCRTPAAHYSFSEEVIKITTTLDLTWLTPWQASYQVLNINYFIPSKQQGNRSDVLLFWSTNKEQEDHRISNLTLVRQQSQDRNTSLSYLHCTVLFAWVPVCALL